MEHDDTVGFQVISTDDIDDYGILNVIKKIRQRVGDSPVYLSLDIDVVDPGLAPASQFSFIPFFSTEAGLTRLK